MMILNTLYCNKLHLYLRKSSGTRFVYVTMRCCEMHFLKCNKNIKNKERKYEVGVKKFSGNMTKHLILIFFKGFLFKPRISQYSFINDIEKNCFENMNQLPEL